jgi:hypothetical protein
MAFWANLHGSFLFGFVLTAPLALEALVAARGRRWATLRAWGVFGGLCLAAGLLTPHGLAAFTYPLNITNMQTLDSIIEWRPQDFSQPSCFELALMATLFLAMSCGVKVPPFRMVLLLAVTHMALQHHRHEMVLALTAPVLLARPFAEAVARPVRAERLRGAIPAAGVALALLLTLARLAAPVTRGDSGNTPQSAFARVPAAVAAQPVLNSYDFGGFLIFHGVRPYIDGRSDMYGDALFRGFLAMSGGDLSRFDAAVRRYGIGWTLLRPSEPLAAALDHDPRWRQIYRDRFAVVHVRVASGDIGAAAGG